MKIFGYEITRNRVKSIESKPQKNNDSDSLRDKRFTGALPGRVSDKDSTPNLIIPDIFQYEIPNFIFEVIPIIRKLAISNEDVGQVIFDLTQLCNTGYKIKFDKKVKPKEVDDMRRHLYNKSKTWGCGVAGLDGLINKMIAQILIGGALSNEWVIDKDMKGVQNVFLVKPETIRFKYNNKDLKYDAYQVVKTPHSIEKTNIKLNPFTYKYYGLMGDTESPYGIPPYITALKRISEQNIMDSNINYIMNQLGLMGFFETLIAKPDQNKNENDKVYEARLEGLLTTTKNNLKESLRDGITVGFIDDHEFEFHSTTKNLNGVNELYNEKLKQVSRGLKHPPSLLALDSGKSETQISIIFTKMLSQLKNIQNIIKYNLEFGCALELRLAGFKFDFLDIEFNQSTISDSLKNEQAREIQLRNLKVLYDQGIISQDTYADETGYEEPDKPEPRVTVDNSIIDKTKKKEKREKDKDKSDRNNREKSSPQPKRKDQSTKPV